MLLLLLLLLIAGVLVLDQIREMFQAHRREVSAHVADADAAFVAGELILSGRQTGRQTGYGGSCGGCSGGSSSSRRVGHSSRRQAHGRAVCASAGTKGTAGGGGSSSSRHARIAIMRQH